MRIVRRWDAIYRTPYPRARPSIQGDIMRLQLLAAACGCMAITACTTDIKPVRYHSTSPTSKVSNAKDITLGTFSDARGVDSSILCTVRNAYGIPVKTVKTDKPVADIVRTDFADALSERGYAQSASGAVSLSGTISKLGCDYVMSKAFVADMQLNVYSMPTHALVFQQTYSTHHTEGGAGAGILADVDGLTKIEEDVINQTVDKAFADTDFVAALSGVMAVPGQAPAGSPTDERLKKLDDLKAQGLITDGEYAAKRKEIIDSL